MLVKEAVEIAGRLSTPSKMPGLAWGIPARLCQTGSILREQAGSVCEICYAFCGRYVMPPVEAAYQRRFDLWKAADNAGVAGAIEWAKAIAAQIRSFYKRHHDGSNPMKDGRYFRVFDSGDLQSTSMLYDWCNVANMLPEVNFWMATKERQMVRSYLKNRVLPSNMLVRVSGSRVDGPAPQGFTHTSAVVTMNDEADWAEKVASSTKDRHYCPAELQGHECRSCRACWDPEVRCVVYAKS